MISSLLYLTATRSDIQFAVYLCARYQASPRTSHHQAVKHIFKYLKFTSELGLWYSSGTSLVSWSSRKQANVALSTTESEYVAAASCCSQLLWIKATLSDFGLKFGKIPLLVDSTSSIFVAKNPGNFRPQALSTKFRRVRVRSRLHIKREGEELNNFTRNEVWELVERPKNYNVISTKWVFHNKHDENGIVVRNKVRLVAQGYTQVEGLDFGETFAPILLAVACAHSIKLFQMDVKSALVNGKNSELMYVEQPPSFEDPKNLDHVYKLSKALYGLKHAPRAWYERLRDFLVSKGFKIGKVDTTLFTKSIGKDLFICQIYVDDIIFGFTNASFCEEFGEMMSKEFEM
ncbi:hypothetical protein U9M48_024201 [Paspalum notatum var. saurae]|uniref:Reverse transcriptase Ty1/copia-type domain-containing protein n=1 Tax=Paspalum notatum var. saurae TaxID=547442 RepID=A0AAQ3WWT8_PASNO